MRLVELRPQGSVTAAKIPATVWGPNEFSGVTLKVRLTLEGRLLMIGEVTPIPVGVCWAQLRHTLAATRCVATDQPRMLYQVAGRLTLLDCHSGNRNQG